METHGNVVKLPRRSAEHPTVKGATFYDIGLGRIRMALGRLANRLGIPGFIRDTVIDDPVTGQQIEIRVSLLSVRLSVNGRDYYFGRFSGKLEGAGMGCVSQPSRCISAPTPESGPFPGHPCRL